MKKIFRNCPHIRIESCNNCTWEKRCLEKKERKRRERFRRKIARILCRIMIVIVIVLIIIIGISIIKSDAHEKIIQESKYGTIRDSFLQEGNLLESESELELEPDLEEGYSEEVDLLARLIHCEAGICDNYEKYFVGTVVMNRIDSSDFPNTLNEVIYQDGQYGCIDKLYEEEPTSDEYEIAKDIWNGTRTLPMNVLFQTGYETVGEIYIRTQWHYYSTSSYE